MKSLHRGGDFPGSSDDENVRVVTSYEDRIPVFGKDPRLFPTGKS